jgi:hypothetical protein
MLVKIKSTSKRLYQNLTKNYYTKVPLKNKKHPNIYSPKNTKAPSIKQKKIQNFVQNVAKFRLWKINF